MSTKHNPKRLGSNSVDMGDRGIYDKRNKLNDRTGREWLFFTNSVWITGYSPTAKDNIGLKYRKIHPSPKPPALIKDIVEFFTKPDGKVLDPFAGVGGTALGCELAAGHRTAVSIELEQKYIDAYHMVCESEGFEPMTMIHDDSANMLTHQEVSKGTFDLIVADPPYSNMMSKERTGTRAKRKSNAICTPYSQNENDLGNMDEKLFLISLRTIMTKAASRLKLNGYIVVFCKDFQPRPGHPNLLHATLVTELCKIEGIEYSGLRIWHDQAMSLYPFGYPYSFVMNQIHQYVLIFRKVEG